MSRFLRYTAPMDVIALAFYACVCGLLSAFAPQLSTFYVRLGVGAVVGIVAATVLPLIKVAMGN
ncbi:hypothetical protein SAMN04488515_2743 [Cognatiyoonia koreensis]|uniref:Uncharacterized protein n=1 Tax=Cognatiyoonia koreensis TaxID=364200 RepID=A0A1I0RIK4_9RHOB|nr:hypothetical protein [Cognatiyoonia koreensis]SEW40790.1 hypothetical protein SAMN04488515_2743 [Cognatiyoonia koreensis]